MSSGRSESWGQGFNVPVHRSSCFWTKVYHLLVYDLDLWPWIFMWTRVQSCCCRDGRHIRDVNARDSAGACGVLPSARPPDRWRCDKSQNPLFLSRAPAVAGQDRQVCFKVRRECWPSQSAYCWYINTSSELLILEARRYGTHQTRQVAPKERTRARMMSAVI